MGATQGLAQSHGATEGHRGRRRIGVGVEDPPDITPGGSPSATRLVAGSASREPRRCDRHDRAPARRRRRHRAPSSRGRARCRSCSHERTRERDLEVIPLPLAAEQPEPLGNVERDRANRAMQVVRELRIVSREHRRDMLVNRGNGVESERVDLHWNLRCVLPWTPRPGRRPPPSSAGGVEPFRRRRRCVAEGGAGFPPPSTRAR